MLHVKPKGRVYELQGQATGIHGDRKQEQECLQLEDLPPHLRLMVTWVCRVSLLSCAQAVTGVAPHTSLGSQLFLLSLVTLPPTTQSERGCEPINLAGLSGSPRGQPEARRSTAACKSHTAPPRETRVSAPRGAPATSYSSHHISHLTRYFSRLPNTIPQSSSSSPMPITTHFSSDLPNSIKSLPSSFSTSG